MKKLYNFLFSGKLKWITWIFFIVVSISILYFFLKSAYQVKWTGFGEVTIETLPNQTFTAGKTLWDWLELFIIPLALVLGGYVLNRSEKRQEIRLSKERAESDRVIAENRNQEIALSEYFDRMSDLLLDSNLKDSIKDSIIRDVARTRTLTIFRRMKGERKAVVLNFLAESELILKGDTKTHPIINLKNANLNGIKLSVGSFMDIELEGVSLRNSDIYGTKFQRAILTYCDFLGSKMEWTEFQGAYLMGSRFNKGNLDCSNFSHSTLYNVCFFRSSLKFVDFTKAELEGADLKYAILDNALLEGTKMEHARYFTQEQLDRAYYIDVPPSLPKHLNPPPKISRKAYDVKSKIFRRSKTAYVE